MTKKTNEELKIEVGQVFDISLESMMGSTGYGWELCELTGPISLIGISVVPTATGIAPVNQVFMFRGTAVGKGEIAFILTAAWKLEDPIEKIVYQVEVIEQEKPTEDDLKLKGYVAAPKAMVRENAQAPLYNVQTPVLEYGIPCADLWHRVYYGVLPQNFASADPRTYYGVCCDPSKVVSFGDVRMYYGIRCAPLADADPRFYYGVCCAPETASIADPRLYYGVCCAKDNDECGTPPHVYKYGIWPRQLYNVYTPVAKYNIPPMMRYNYPDKC